MRCFGQKLDLPWQTMLQSCVGPVTNRVWVGCWTCCDKPSFSLVLDLSWQMFQSGAGLVRQTMFQSRARILVTSMKSRSWPKPFLNNMRCWLRKSWSAGNVEYFGQELELIVRTSVKLRWCTRPRTAMRCWSGVTLVMTAMTLRWRGRKAITSHAV